MVITLRDDGVHYAILMKPGYSPRNSPRILLPRKHSKLSRKLFKWEVRYVILLSTSLHDHDRMLAVSGSMPATDGCQWVRSSEPLPKELKSGSHGGAGIANIVLPVTYI